MQIPLNNDDFLPVAISAAQAGAEVSMKHFGRDLDYATKHNPSQIVSVADTESEKAIIKIIAEAFPHHGILAEEGTSTNPDSPYLWSVDPIDGTLAYAHHLPYWCTSISLLKNLEPLVAVVLMPTGLFGQKLLFSAVKGNGAYCNDKQIHVSDIKQLKHTFLHWNYSPEDFPSSAQAIMHKLAPLIIYANTPPSVAVTLALIANSNLSAYAHTDLEHWDMAAGVLLVEEAGGMCTTLKGKPINWEPSSKFNLLASNKHLHSQLLDAINN